MEAVVQTNQFYIDSADYTELTRATIMEILACRNMSNEMESLQIQLDMSQRSAVEVNLRFDRVLSRWGDEGLARLKAGSCFRNAPVFDGKQPKKLRSWIIHLRNKLGVKLTIYGNSAAQVM